MIGSSMKTMLLSLGAFFVIIYLFEARAGADKSRYLSRGFVNDFVYNVFYRGGIYAFFIYLPIMGLVGPRVSFNLLEPVPLPVKVVLYWLVRDFLAYWTHRAQHAFHPLWAFHKVHHSQERMTFLTTSRFHLVDQILNHVVLLIPLMLLFGPSPGTWLAIHVTTEFILFVQHSELRWSYGRLHGVIVSPAFHAVHHSADPAHHGRNFGMLFSFWDLLFGTALRAGGRPPRFGVPGWETPESFLRQFVDPFRSLLAPEPRGSAALRPGAAPGEPI